MMKIFKGLDKVEDLRIQRGGNRQVVGENGDSKQVQVDEGKEKEYQDAKKHVDDVIRNCKLF
jgi:hypothetical protein